MLIDQIHDDLKKAQIARDELQTSTLRLLLSELKYAEIKVGHDLSDQDVVSVIQKEAKKRQEAATAFKNGNRPEMAEKEEAELKVLTAYLPEQLNDEVLKNIVKEAMVETGAKSVVDMGRVIGVVMGKVQGQADGSRISQLVKEELGVLNQN